jgi:hypothetical protein
MNVVDSLKLLDQYGKCSDCGNDKLGDGEGTLSIDGNEFRRTCKCGFEIEETADK